MPHKSGYRSSIRSWIYERSRGFAQTSVETAQWEQSGEGRNSSEFGDSLIVRFDIEQKNTRKMERATGDLGT